MQRIEFYHDKDLSPGSWWLPLGAQKPYIACPLCGGTLLGDKVTHVVSDSGEVNASVVCRHPGCNFHKYITLSGWKGTKMEHLEMTVEEQIYSSLLTALVLMEEKKPNDRSERDRLWAILKTDLQKVEALWSMWMLLENIPMDGKPQVSGDEKK